MQPRYAALAFFLAVSGPVLAQTAPPAASNEKPLDRGPDTPAANSAYGGGGVVLQGAPGAPAPKPEALPPQAPPPKPQ